MDKIVSKDKSFIYIEPNGQIWVNDEGREHVVSCGAVIHHACNIHRTYGIPSKYDKYFPVNIKILRFAKKLGIKKLRLIMHISKLVKYGWKVNEQYGYISRSKFKRLLHRRKTIALRTHKIVLLKESDAEWKDE